MDRKFDGSLTLILPERLASDCKKFARHISLGTMDQRKVKLGRLESELVLKTGP